MELTATADTTAPPERVWELLADPTTYADWWVEWHSAKTDDMPLEVGSAVTMRRIDHDPEKGGVNEVRDFHNYRMPVTECDPGRRLAIQNRSIGTEDFVFTIEPIGSGSRITYERRAKVPRLMKLLGKAMQGRLERQVEESVTGLAQLAEGGAPPG
jgi:uncharacterized protein YndB with AHSA1/START domain